MALWLGFAGLARVHQDAYMGHGPKTMTELYQSGNERPYLAADAVRARTWILAALQASAPEPGPVEETKLRAAVADAPRRS